MASGSEESSSGSHEVQPSGWDPQPLGPGPTPYPDYDRDVFHDSINKLTVQEWDEIHWPTKKARLAWRLEQWRNQLTELVSSHQEWFAHICQIYRELSALQTSGNLNGTPLVVRQYLVLKWQHQGLEQLLADVAEWNPKGVLTRSRNKPQRDAMLEFIERQVDVGERDYTQNCTRNFAHKYGDI